MSNFRLQSNSLNKNAAVDGCAATELDVSSNNMINKFLIFIFFIISCASNHNKTHSFIFAQVTSSPTEVYSEWGKLNSGEKFENRFLGVTINYLDSKGNSQNAMIVFPSTNKVYTKLLKLGDKVKISNAIIAKYFLPIKTPNVNIDEISKLE